MRQAAWGLHRALAVVLGLWVAVQSASGLVLLFADPIEHRLNAELTRHGHGDKGAAAAVAAVRQRYPGEAIGVVATPAVSDGVYVVEVGEREIYVDPAGPRINGVRDHDRGFVALVARVHGRVLFDSLPGGLSGPRVVGGLGVAWLVLTLSGLTAATPATPGRLGRWRARHPARLHRTIGVLVAAPLVLVVVTGIRLALPAGSDRVWAAITRSGQARPDLPPAGVRITSDDRGGVPRDATDILAALQRRYPDGRVARLLMPRPDDRAAPVIAGVSVPFDPGRGEHDYGGNTVVFLDQFSGDTLWVGRPDSLPAARQAALLWSRPLHTGSVAGELGRLLWGGLAVAVMALTVLGWMTRRARLDAARRAPGMWQRQLRRRKALARRERTHTARAAQAARHRRRTSRQLRRRRKVQARTLARMGLASPPGQSPPVPDGAGHLDGAVGVNLTDTAEIDLTDRGAIDLRDRPDLEPHDAPNLSSPP